MILVLKTHTSRKDESAVLKEVRPLRDALAFIRSGLVVKA